MGTPSYLLRPRLARFATSGCPFYLPERGWARNCPPPRSRELKVHCYRDHSPLSLLWKNSTSPCTLGPLWRALARCHSPFTHTPPISDAPPRVLYPGGPELLHGGCGPHSWPLRVDRMPRHAPPSAVALKGPELLIRQGVQGSAYPPPSNEGGAGVSKGQGSQTPPHPNDVQGSATPSTNKGFHQGQGS